MAREIPRIFESVRRESLSDGFLGALRGGNRDGRDQSPGTDGPVRFRHPGFPSTGKDCFEPRVRIWNQEMLLSFLCPDLKIVGVDILDDKGADTKNSLHESDFRSSSRRPCRTAPRWRWPAAFPRRHLRLRDSHRLTEPRRLHARGPDLETSQSLLLAEMSRLVRPGGTRPWSIIALSVLVTWYERAEPRAIRSIPFILGRCSSTWGKTTFAFCPTATSPAGPIYGLGLSMSSSSAPTH